MLDFSLERKIEGSAVSLQCERIIVGWKIGGKVSTCDNDWESEDRSTSTSAACIAYLELNE